ncbi:carbohydrate-binding protein [Algibacillus agarilyticus]|uniref:carbohydrate-binding protein n=1 Tax=Algibacillus agarilyticus TaxID=2234133 RepID=UPI000DD09FB8|nr:carbohydrate-binding protein [Algibacillus agarilyticus]
MYKTKRTLLNMGVAMALATTCTQALADSVIIEAENYVNVGGTFVDNQPEPVGIYTIDGKQAINYVNAGDFVDYNINVAGGEYAVEYLVGTNVASGPAIELLTNENGTWVSQGTVAVPADGWNNFQPLSHSKTITLPSGASTIRLHAMGSNWQWNLESFSLTSVNVDPDPVAPGESFVIEMEDFDATGGRVSGAIIGERGLPSDMHTVVDSVQNGDWVDYQINFPVSGNYSIDMLASSQNVNANAALYIDGELINEEPVFTDGQANFETFPLTTSTYVSAGIHTVRVEATTSAGNGWMWFGDNLTITSLGGNGGDNGNGTNEDGDIVIELEDFFNTGARNKIGGDSVLGFGKTAEGVNFVTNGDYGDYKVTFTQPGTYQAYITISAGTGSYGARIMLDDWPVAHGYMTDTGGVAKEFGLAGGHFSVQKAGTYDLRVQAYGGSDWQWTGDNVRIERVGNYTPAPAPHYDPADHFVAEINGPKTDVLHLSKPVNIPASKRVLKADVWYTYPQNSQLAGYDNFGATGAFWGHPPEHDFYDDTTIIDWTELVSNFQNQGIEYTARGEFDWGYGWFTEYTTNPEPHYVRTLDDTYVRMTFMGYHSHDGFNNNWLSNHSPAFVPFMKSQVDQILKANPNKLMFDTQTNSTRTTDMRTFGGDFSPYAMQNFRIWLDKKYSNSQLAAMGINNINTFDYKQHLINAGITHDLFRNGADKITGDIPMVEDFIYFNRDVWNQKFGEVLTYIRQQRPDIEIGASTHLFESRGYIFNENITFLSGELNLGAKQSITELPTKILAHLKGAQAVGKTLAYFPYPWEFAELKAQNAPRFGRGWVAQAYAYGGIFSIPANVWLGGDGVWSPGADNYRDIYKLVRNKARLFNNYTSYSKVGLVHAMYSSMKAGFIDGGGTMQNSVKLLTEGNFNFDMLVFGDEGYPVVPRAEDFDKFDVIFTDGDLQYLTDDQKAVLDAQGSKVKHIGQRGNYADTVIAVNVNGTASNDTVSAVSRIHQSNANAPYVVHLINRPFANGVTPTLNGVKVSIPQGYFPENVTSAKLHLPGGSTTNLTVTTNANGEASVTVNNLEVWGLLELIH